MSSVTHGQSWYRWRTLESHEATLPGHSNLAEALHLQPQICPEKKRLLTFFPYMPVIKADAPAQHHVFPAKDEMLVLWAGDIGLVATPRRCVILPCLFILLAIGSMNHSMDRLTRTYAPWKKKLFYWYTCKNVKCQIWAAKLEQMKERRNTWRNIAWPFESGWGTPSAITDPSCEKKIADFPVSAC
jgi:hypothetical protein